MFESQIKKLTKYTKEFHQKSCIFSSLNLNIRATNNIFWKNIYVIIY